MHSHSTASDGALAPAALVRRAADMGLDGLALTDHDCVEGVEEALAAAVDCGLDLIPGIELSIQVGVHDIHVLGYWIEHRDPELRRILAELVDMRHRRAERIVEKLGELGMELDFADVLAQADGGNPGRPHIAKALLAHGHIGHFDEAFERYIGDEGPANVPKSLMDPTRGFALFKRFGAVTVFAHPALCDYESHLPRFLALGLNGLEADHPKHTAPERQRLREHCRRLDLVATGGSDFHMPGASSRELGAEGVAGETVAALRALRPEPDPTAP